MKEKTPAIRISADSTCGIGPDLAQQYRVTIVPLIVMKGNEACKDSVDITNQDILAFYDRSGELCKTSAVNQAEYETLFRRLTADGAVHSARSGHPDGLSADINEEIALAIPRNDLRAQCPASLPVCCSRAFRSS